MATEIISFQLDPDAASSTFTRPSTRQVELPQGGGLPESVVAAPAAPAAPAEPEPAPALAEPKPAPPALAAPKPALAEPAAPEPAPEPAPVAPVLLPQNVQFDKWVRSMFDVLLDFATMTCSTLAGKSDKAMLRLREMIQRMKLMAENVNMADPPDATITRQLHTALSVLPQPIAQVLQHTFSRVSQLHQQVLEAEAEWTQEWLQLHLAMLGTFFGIAVRIQQKWSSDVTNVASTITAWESIVDRMMSPQHEKLSKRVEEVSQSWLGFCLKYAQTLQDRGEDTAAFLAEQQAIVDGVGALNLNLSLTLALEIFQDRCSQQDRTLAPTPSPHLEEQQRQMVRLGELEEAMLGNRKERHAAWVAVQHQNTQPDFMQHIQRLDETYADQQREAKLVQNLLQEQHAAKPATAPLPSAPSEAAAKAWHEQAERFRPIVQQLERQLLRYQSMTKLLQRTIYEVHDEVLVTTLTEVCARLQKVKQDGLRKMEGTIQIRSRQVAGKTQLLRQQLEVLLRESSTYGKAHEIAISEIQAVHHHIRDCAEQAAKYEARQSTLRALEQFVHKNDALQTMLQRRE
jgi:hypothetical protein